MIPLLSHPSLAAPHGFFTRAGGVSTGAFSSLNCSLSGRDDPAHVAINRERVALALGFAPASLLGLYQVHGAAVADADAPWPETARPEADALVASRPGALLGIVTADCAPVLFADAEAGVIGAAHAGWRGAVAGVLEATLDAMRTKGARRITAVVGPCIAAPSYEVGPDLRDAVLARAANDARFFARGQRDDRWQFDLPGYCLARLIDAGAAAQGLGRDTLAEPDAFFSYRRATLAGALPIGHQISAIGLRD